MGTMTADELNDRVLEHLKRAKAWLTDFDKDRECEAVRLSVASAELQEALDLLDP